MKGRIVGITGGASGIGLSTAKLLASRGAKISIADNCPPGHLEEALIEIRAMAHSEDDVTTYHCDVSKADQVCAWLEATTVRWGRLDHVANVAGVWSKSRIDEVKEEDWDKVIDTNLKGTMLVLREATTLMRDHAQCSVVLVSSVCGFRAVAENPAYCASKYGVIGLTKSAAIDMGSRGIRVNCVAPGMVDTPLARNGPGLDFAKAFSSQTPMSRLGNGFEIAKVIAFLLGEECSFVTGDVWTVDGGASV